MTVLTIVLSSSSKTTITTNVRKSKSGLSVQKGTLNPEEDVWLAKEIIVLLEKEKEWLKWNSCVDITVSEDIGKSRQS